MIIIQFVTILALPSPPAEASVCNRLSPKGSSITDVTYPGGIITVIISDQGRMSYGDYNYSLYVIILLLVNGSGIVRGDQYGDYN